MDECLSIPEILPLLCDGLEAKDLLSTALSCRAFLEPALDKLWYHVKSFKPLIACLPEDLVELRTESVSETVLQATSTTVVLRRSIRSADLNRYQTQYARRVRIFELGYEENILVLPPEVFQDLQSATDPRLGGLTPLATELIWSSTHNASAFPYLPLFLGRHVAKIDFEVTPTVLNEIVTVWWASNHVHRFKLKFSRPHTTEEFFLNAFIPLIPWANLQELELSTSLVTLLAIPPLMVAPHLVKLTMMVEAGESIIRPATPSPHHSRDVMSSLQCLNISTNHPDAAMIALEYLPERNQLQSLTCFFFDGDESPSTAHRLFDLINSKCNAQTFSHLDLQGCPGPAREEDDVDKDDYVDISALLSLSGLTHVEIFLPAVRVELAPEHVATIPTAWPRVERLILNTNFNDRGSIRPRIDPTHLAAILRGCSHLRILGLRFDATHIGGGGHLNQNPDEEERKEDVEDVAWQCGLEELYVSDSPILSSSQMTAFLRAHAPKLRKLCCLYRCDKSREFITESYDQRWNDVASGIGASNAYY